MPPTIVPCLWFDRDAEDAAKLYASVLPDASVGSLTRFGAAGREVHGGVPGDVMTVEITLGGRPFVLLNGGPDHPMNPSISFYVYADDADASKRIFDALSEDGEVLMPFDAYPWNPAYGWVQDRFGATWQILAGVPDGATRRVVPCLSFVNDAFGRAREALERYARLFEEGQVLATFPYEDDVGPEGAGAISHGRARLAGQELIAMDAGGEHAWGFTDGVSLQILVDDQAELDRYWDGLLADGGEPVACGWLTDRYGVVWQVTPRGLSALLRDPDREKADRVMEALIDMVKLDVRGFEDAARG